MTRATRISWDADGWDVAPVASPRRGPARDPLVARLLRNPKLALEEELRAAPKRRGPTGPLRLSVRTAAGETAVVAARRPSGAITFHRASTDARLGTARELTFEIEAGSEATRRGPVRALALFVLRVLGRWTDRALPDLSRAWETARWQKSERPLGFVRITSEGLLRGRLAPAAAEIPALPPPPARSLVLLHGTFSDAAAAFRGLAETSRGAHLRRIVAAYEGRVYAFDHFTVSATPEENARAFLAALPERRVILDFLTHSRGGLVLRTLLEHPSLADERRRKLEPGRAVLAASPNGGTPLASPERWEEAVGVVANLADMFPGGPLSLGLDFVTEAVVWIARRAGGALPGLAPMAPGSPFLRALPGSSRDACSALAANYVAPAALHLRLLDAGVDRFFRGANDLVVPAEGGWRLGDSALDGARVLCFGPGGNAKSGALHHLNLFDAPEACAFAARALLGEAHPHTALDVSAALPWGKGRESRERRTDGHLKGGARRSDRPRAKPRSVPRASGPTRRPRLPRPDAFELFLLPSGPGDATLLASWGRARAISRLATRGGADGERMRRIVELHERILRTLDGRSAAPLPTRDELVAYGGLLFEALFPPDVRRLYDAARAAANGRRLDVVFTSAVDWIADKPWELAYDPARRAFLAAEDVNFVRDVVTSVPAERAPSRRGPLRVLLATARPRALARIAAKEELARIARGLGELAARGLASVETLEKATPESLHAALASSRFHVLHFVGHGAWDPKDGTGALFLEDGRGGSRPVEAEVLRRLLTGRGLELVFLNACETARGGRADWSRGVAQALSAGGLPAVLANQYSVLDVSAAAFARRFYEALALGESLGDAAREARLAVAYTPGESIGWAVPVLFARDPALALVKERA